MAEEINEGTAYLMSLKQPVRTQSPAAPQNPTDAATVSEAESLPASSAGDSFQGTEKRRSPRYKCEGSAEVREDGCDVRTWAAFTDVSLHGCYLEAQATYPAGTTVHMKLEVKGIRVETKGTVRVNYPYLGMGIAFTEMSEQDRANLRRLVATVSRPCMVVGPGIASSLPASRPLDGIPLITDPAAAVEALVEFYEHRQILVREDFLRLLKKSQR